MIYLAVPAVFGSHHQCRLLGCKIPNRLETLVVVGFWIICLTPNFRFHEIFTPNVMYEWYSLIQVKMLTYMHIECQQLRNRHGNTLPNGLACSPMHIYHVRGYLPNETMSSPGDWLEL
jgi:hypothetical protein